MQMGAYRFYLFKLNGDTRGKWNLLAMYSLYLPTYLIECNGDVLSRWSLNFDTIIIACINLKMIDAECWSPFMPKMLVYSHLVTKKLSLIFDSPLYNTNACRPRLARSGSTTHFLSFRSIRIRNVKASIKGNVLRASPFQLQFLLREECPSLRLLFHFSAVEKLICSFRWD